MTTQKANAIVRRVRRSSPDRRWGTGELAQLLGTLPRQIYKYRARGKLSPCPSVGGRTEYANEEVLRFLLEDYHATKRGGEVARG